MQKSFVQKTALIVVGLFVLLNICHGIGRAVVGQERPNVVLIVIDTLRADHLPFYGYPKNTAPFLTELASKSVVFNHAYSVSSWTAPATASIFTSLYPIQHGVEMGLVATRELQKQHSKIELNRIPEEISTIAEVLKDNGYKTYAVPANGNIRREEGFTQGFDRFSRPDFFKSAETVNDEVREWAEEMQGAEPFFLYVHYNDPHEPYEQRSPWYQEGESEESSKIAAYDSEISYVDQRIRELFEFFRWQDKTLLIVTSDHGEHLNDRGGSWGHGGDLYSELINVPFLVYYPEGKWRSREIESRVSILDILPTVRELVGLSSDETLAGVSLVALMQNKQTDRGERRLFSFLRRRKMPPDMDVVKKSLIYKNWKYIISSDGSAEMFDLKIDPREQQNKIRDNPELAKALKREIVSFEENCKKYVKQDSTLSISEKQLQELKSLGYLQ